MGERNIGKRFISFDAVAGRHDAVAAGTGGRADRCVYLGAGTRITVLLSPIIRLVCTARTKLYRNVSRNFTVIARN
jgi:hypothetical protein